jgi:hypothetical protein
MRIRARKFYKELTHYTACAYAERFGEGENATYEQQLCAWQYIKDTGIWRKLQGFYGRNVFYLSEQGLIK